MPLLKTLFNAGLALVALCGIATSALYLSLYFHTTPYLQTASVVSVPMLPSPTPAATKEVELVAVGDIMLSRTVARKMKLHGNDYPFIKIQDEFLKGDITIANLENPITQGREIQNGEMVFHADPGAEHALRDAGISFVSLANNHSMNFGEKGIVDTMRYLSDVGIAYAGAGGNDAVANAPSFVQKNGLTFAFLSYVDPSFTPYSYEATANRAGVAFMRIPAMQESVREAKQHADFVIILMHAGLEYADGTTNIQREFAHAAIDAGAEMVIGAHPHVVEPLEKYQGKYIFYSLGNFIFDQVLPETKRGLMLQVAFTKHGVEHIDLVPLVIEDFSQPRVMEENEIGNFFDRLQYPVSNDPVFSMQ